MPDTYSVDKEHHGLRLDKYLATVAAELSRSRIKSLIEEGRVTRAGVVVVDCSAKVKEGDVWQMDVPPVEPSHMLPNSEIALDVVYEDDQFLIINKQAGLTVHPGAGNQQETMANALLAHCGDELSGVGGVARPGIVHRLDKDTSGLILVAKTDTAHHHLSRQIAERSLLRVYTAFCWGVPKPHTGTIETHIDRHPRNRLKMSVVSSGGKLAVTHYAVKKIYANGLASQVECQLQTGRTHQIRVHMAHIGHPLIGDPLYNPKHQRALRGASDELRDFLSRFNRQALHSSQVGVEHPVTGDYIEKRSPLPSDIAELEKWLNT